MPRRAPTDRELRTLAAAVRPGSSIAIAAHELGISPDTVHSRLRRLYSKLGVQSMAQATYRVWVEPATSECDQR